MREFVQPAVLTQVREDGQNSQRCSAEGAIRTTDATARLCNAFTVGPPE